MRKSLFRSIAAVAFAAIASLSLSVSAATSAFVQAGFESPSVTQTVKSASAMTIAAIATTDQASPAALESKPVLLVHRIPSTGEQAVVLGKVRSIRLNRTYADREAEGRSPGEKAIA